MAVSGHSVTQSMQPVQFSVMYSGISGEMLLKSRSVAVPAGTSERARRQVGGQVLLAVAFLVAADDALVEIVDVEHRQVDQLVGPIDQRAVAVVVERVAFVGLVHRGRGGRLAAIMARLLDVGSSCGSMTALGLEYVACTVAMCHFSSESL